jgi:hypothetical protein
MCVDGASFNVYESHNIQSETVCSLIPKHVYELNNWNLETFSTISVIICVIICVYINKEA